MHMLLLACTLFSIGDSVSNPLSMDHLCAAPATKQTPLFTEDIQYAPVQYENEHTIDRYDIINEEDSKWPFEHNLWGFKAASISTSGSTKRVFTENILISAIPIYVPVRGRGLPPLAIARPQGKHFYVFSAAPYTEFVDGGPQSPYTAVGIVFFNDKFKQITDFRILTTPSFGSFVDGSGQFCNEKIGPGICFGEERCCEAFERILAIRTHSKCKTILLCPKGVIKVDLFSYDASAASKGLAKFAIEGFAIKDTDKNMNWLIRPLLVTEPGYICPDGSYHIRLSCPMIARDVDVDESEFHECPFCSHPNHKYRIIVPEGGEVRGKCRDKDKRTMVSFEFLNDGKVLQCCIQSHSLAEKHMNGAYAKHPIRKDIKLNNDKLKISEESDEVIEEQPITRKKGKKKVSKESGKVTEKQPITRNTRKSGQPINGEPNERNGAKHKRNGLNKSGFATFSVTRSMIFGVLIGILMLIASLHIYFK